MAEQDHAPMMYPQGTGTLHASPRGMSTAEVGLSVMNEHRAGLPDGPHAEWAYSRPVSAGVCRKFTNAEARAQVLRTPGATLDEDSPAYPESWKGRGLFAVLGRDCRIRAAQRGGEASAQGVAATSTPQEAGPPLYSVPEEWMGTVSTAGPSPVGHVDD